MESISRTHHVKHTRAVNTLIIVMSIFSALGTFFVFLRLICRHLIVHCLGFDDFFIFFAWLWSMGLLAAISAALHFGLGLDLEDVSPEILTQTLKALTAGEWVYYMAIVATKVSILLLYYRIALSVPGKLLVFTRYTIVVMVIFWVTTLIVAFTQCIPISKDWHPLEAGKCVNPTIFYYYTQAFGILADVWILALPMPLFWSIRHPTLEKYTLLGIFSVGFVVTAVSCIRLYAIQVYTLSKEPLRDSAPIIVWSFIEINLGLACASVPALKCLFKRPQNAQNSYGSSGADTVFSRSESNAATTAPDTQKLSL